MSSSGLPSSKNDEELLERVLRSTAEMMRGLENLSCEEKLSELGLYSLENAERGSYKYLKGGFQEEGARLFSVVPSDRRRGNRHKLQHRKFQLIMKKIFTFRVTEH